MLTTYTYHEHRHERASLSAVGLTIRYEPVPKQAHWGISLHRRPFFREA